MSSAACPSQTTLATQSGTQLALRTTPNCSSSTLALELTPSGDLALLAQQQGTVRYVHASDFPAAVVNVSENPLVSVDFSSANSSLTHIALRACNISSFAGLALPRTNTDAWNLTLDLSANRLERVDASALPTRLFSLSLASNALTAVANTSLPDSLVELSLANNAIKRIELTRLPQRLRLLDLSGNSVESLEIRESDVPVAQSCLIRPTIRLTSCIDSLAKLRSVGDHRLCVVSDERFELKKYTALVSTADIPDTEVTSPAESASSATAPTLSVVLGILYAVVGLAALLAMAFVGQKMREHRRARRRKHEASVPPLKPSSTSSEDLSLVESALHAQGSPSVLESYRVPDGSVALDALVSSCAGLQLHMATLRTASSGGGDESTSVRRVLATHLAPGLAAREPQLVAAFMDEVKQSAAIAHPAIVPFLGYCQLAVGGESAVCALNAQPPNGDLEHFLTKRPQDWQWLPDSSGATALRPKAAIALDMIDALVHLHTRSPKRFVGSLRAKKVWLDSDFRAALYCFGSDSRFGAALLPTPSVTSLSGSVSSPTALSRQHSPTSTSASSCPHESSVAWMAPEVLRGQQSASEQSDIYAFGVLLTELDTCELPYSLGIDDLDREQVATLVSSGCIRPALSIDCPAPIRALILKCLSFSPGDRPLSVEVQSTLRKLVERSQEARATPVRRDTESREATLDHSGGSTDAEGEGRAGAATETADQIV